MSLFPSMYFLYHCRLFSLCTERASYVFSSRMVLSFFYLVTTGWIFDTSLCGNSINQSINQSIINRCRYIRAGEVQRDCQEKCIFLLIVKSDRDLPICSPWTFRENHSPNIIYTMNRRNQPTAMDLYFLNWVRTRYKTEPETHTKSAHTVL